MINQDKWVNSLPKTNTKYDEDINKVDHSRWINTIPQKKTYNNVAWKYSLVAVLFVCGLLFVSAIKNKTRNLEKEINNLRASNSVIKFNLHQAILDNAVITSPENISRLAKEYLNTDLISYKKSQIKQLNEDKTIVTEDMKIVTKLNKENNNLSTKIKSVITKKIEKKKTEIRKLQELYSNPESIPGEVKTQIASRIKKKKTELQNLYNSPKKTITLEKARQWVIVQVAKLFLGIPIVPGR
tara:strand:+ start:948 stop:1670 length:723 start_codon:yes stop_codon:yes gene_type:complete